MLLKATALHAAVYVGLENVASVLLGHGADVNARDRRGSTALQAACVRGHETCAKLLL